uniref:acyl carrier protein n=2 Tax=Flavobacterium sp. TaxID=239 RepID=UPI00404A15B8
MEQDFIAKLKKIAEPYVENKNLLENITRETDFIQDLKINSANLVDVVLDIEEEFDITIDTVSMEKMLTVGAALDIIQEKLNTPE